jgi:hypothetical protein
MTLASFCRKRDKHTEGGKYGDLHALISQLNHRCEAVLYIL